MPRLFSLDVGGLGFVCDLPIINVETKNEPRFYAKLNPSPPAKALPVSFVLYFLQHVATSIM